MHTIKIHTGGYASPVDQRRLAHVGKADHAGPHSAWLEAALGTVSVHARARLLHHTLELQQQQISGRCGHDHSSEDGVWDAGIPDSRLCTYAGSWGDNSGLKSAASCHLQTACDGVRQPAATVLALRKYTMKCAGA